ncbi:uncharacterized protein TNCV_3593451 [Trichonephila clavipes]|nr:uncharacterized protein TNCV_3593451 [Trichonephila clavipes]
MNLQLNYYYSRTSYIRTFIIWSVRYLNQFFLSTTCTVYEYVFEQRRNSLQRQSLKNAWNKLWPDLEGEKVFNDDHREEITDFVHSIPGFQGCNDVETWMA